MDGLGYIDMMSLTTHVMLMNSQWAALNGYDADAQAIFAAFCNPPSDQIKAAINTAVISLKSAGVWNKLDSLQVYAAMEECAALVDWKRPSVSATLSNAPGFTPTVGYQFTGVGGQFLNSQYNPTLHATNFTLDNAELGVWVISGGGNIVGAREAFVTMAGSMISYGNGELATNLNAWGYSIDAPAIGVPRAGLLSVARTGTNAVELFEGGVSVASSAQASSSIIDKDLYVGWENGATGSASNALISIFYAGAALGNTERLDFINILNTYFASL